MPNVPNLPGVPPLTSYSVGAAATVLAIDAVALLAGIIGPIRWGVFLNGAPVVFADTVAALDYRKEWQLSDYPVEDGAFETYNKVRVPFETRVRFASGGSAANRQLLLDSVDAIAGDLNLYDVVTPEAIYPNVNVMRYDYRRESANGVGMIVVEVWLRQVRVASAPAFTSTQAPSGASPASGGQVSPQAATPAQESKVPLVH